MIKFIKRAILYVFVLIVAFYLIAPVFWLFITSISTKVDLLVETPKLIPQHPTFDNYIKVFLSNSNIGGSFYQFKISMINSFEIAVMVTLICLCFGSMSAYAFARLNFKGKKPLMFILLFSQMLPTVSISIAMYTILQKVDMLDNKVGMILVYTSFLLPFIIWILQGYFKTVPKELEEAARIDGASRMGTLIRVILPISTPALFAAGAYVFLGSWNEFALALVLTSSEAAKTMPVAISEFMGRYTIDFGLLATGGMVTVIPPIILSLIFQKSLVEGLSAGAVKA